MNRRSYVPLIAISAALFLTGLVLGAGKSAEDTSAANTASKVLLMIGVLAFLATTAIEIVSRRRARRGATTHAREV